jgi:hypothetical protein
MRCSRAELLPVGDLFAHAFAGGGKPLFAHGLCRKSLRLSMLLFPCISRRFCGAFCWSIFIVIVRLEHIFPLPKIAQPSCRGEIVAVPKSAA